MDKNNLVNISNTTITTTSNDYSATRAKSFKVKSSEQNFAQYVRTVKAYALAGLPFNHIANAGDVLGDLVERAEIDAPIQNNWQTKIGETAEDNDQILTWQTRGEKVSIINELAAPNTITGKEIVIISRDLISTGTNQDKTIDVVEGIKVVRKDVVELPNQASNQELENNPYLKSIPQVRQLTD